MGVHSTVVFTDLFGSTGAFEALGNARATEAVTQVTTWISEVVESHGGRVVKKLGDGVLALFGESAAALNAVVAIQRIHRERMTQMPPGDDYPFGLASPVATLRLLQATVGDGDAVNVAARLSDLSGPHQNWANSAALDSVTEAPGVRFRMLGPIGIRGRAEPCTVYQVEWQEDVNSDFLTMQAHLDSELAAEQDDVLGRQIELTWGTKKKTFKSFDLPIHIGRVRQAEFVANDPRVSRSHARIDWRNGSVMLVDVSSYGCWIRFSGGGSDLLLRREECVLHGRGEVALGSSFADVDAPIVKFSVS